MPKMYCEKEFVRMARGIQGMKKQELIDLAITEIDDALDELVSDECDLDIAEGHLKSALAFIQSQPDEADETA